MPSQIAAAPLKASLLLFLSAWSHVASALDPDICASFNTASGGPQSNTPRQSNGLCSDACRGEYAYAITQDEKCWCSNYTPDEGSAVSGSRCNTPCPSYPFEVCGGDGVFSYMQVGQPSGTKGPGSSPDPDPEPSSSPKPEPEPETSTSSSSSTSTSTSTSTSHEPTTSTSSSTSTSTTSSEETSTTEKPTPTSSMVQTVTADGTIKTVTVAATATDPAVNQPITTGDDGGGLSTGAIVGIVIGIVALVLIAVGIFLFWFLRRRKQNHDDYQDDPSVRGSSSGMMGSHRPEMSMSGGSPGSPGSAGNRNSMLQIDPRMDPFKQAYGRNSTESVNTLRDDHDYSRRIQQPKVLRATNPDPE